MRTPELTIPSQESVEAAALRACASEPIQFLGQIQPFGVLLAVDAEELRIDHASANCGELLKIEAEVLLGRPFSDLVGPDQAQQLGAVSGLGEWRASAMTEFHIRVGAETQRMDARISRGGDYWLVELEDPRWSPGEDLFQSSFIPIRDALWELDALDNMRTYANGVVHQVRLLTGFDRVMMYKFDANWDGSVIAESKTDALESYLGNRFPASDIPPQARALYTRSLIRAAADVDAPAVPVRAASAESDAAPLDLSHAALRQFSPVHLQYLRNMGVRSSLSISLVRKGVLWGLIACHHSRPRYVPFRIQELEEFIGKTVSLKLTNIGDERKQAFNLRMKELVGKVTSRMAGSVDIEAVIEPYLEELLGLMRADGLVIRLAGTRHQFGKTLPEGALPDLENWLKGQPENSVFASEELSRVYPPAQAYLNRVAGILAAPLNADMRDYLMWLRPSTLREFRWAGNREKLLVETQGTARIEPRKSFATWLEMSKDRSAPWLPVEVEAANVLSLSIIDGLTQRALKQSEEKYRRLAEHSSDLIARLDSAFRFTYASPSCKDLLGVSAREIVGMSLAHFAHPEDVQQLFDLLKNLPGKGCARNLPLRIIRQDRVLIWIEATFNQAPNPVEGYDEIVINARDVTQRHAYQIALEELHKRNSLILHSAGEGLLSLNPDGVITYANQRAAELLGWRPEELPGRDCGDMLVALEVSPEAASACSFASLLADAQAPLVREITARHRLGHGVPLRCVATPLIQDGVNRGGVVVLHERAESASDSVQSRTRTAILNETMQAVMVVDAQGTITSINRAFTTITGYEEREALGKTSRLLKSGVHTPSFYEAMWRDLIQEQRWSGEIWNRRKNGEIYPQSGSITAIVDENGEAVSYVAVFSDVSQAKQADEKMFFLLHHDALTGLPNRAMFTDILNDTLEQMTRTRSKAALMFIDLDHFKIVNDTLGHAIGDVYLKQVAGRLRSLAQREGFLSRWGGDKFILLVDSVEDPVMARKSAHRVMEVLAEPLWVEGHALASTASIGIALFPDHADNAQDLIKFADASMYRAKSHGSGRLELFTHDFADAARNQFTVAHELQSAVRNGELRLHYQIQVASQNEEITGMEALVRWQHPTRGLLSPALFIPEAEELGLINLVGDWVLNEAVRQIAEWRRDGLVCPKVAINVSANQLTSDFPAKVASTLEEYGVPAGSLEIEITESALKNRGQAVPVLLELKNLGVLLSLDDFGTGYSSLSQLKHFPIDCFKVDKSFIDGLPESKRDAAIVRAIMALGESLEVEVVSEGVEKPDQLRFLKGFSGGSIQGYLFGKPMPAREVGAMMRRAGPIHAATDADR